MVVDKRVLVHSSEDISTGDVVSDLEAEEKRKEGDEVSEASFEA